MTVFPLLLSIENATLQRKILREFSWDSMFQLSLCSSKSKNFVQKYTKRLKKSLSPALEIYASRYICYCYLKNPDHSYCTFKLLSNRHHELPDLKPLLAPRTLEGTDVHLGMTGIFDDGEIEITIVGESPEVGLLTTINYLAHVVNVHVGRCSLSTDFIDDLMPFIDCKYLQSSTQLRLGDGSITPEELTSVLDVFGSRSTHRTLILHPNPGPKFQYSKTISVKKLEVSSSKWFNKAHFLNLDCQDVVLCNQHFSNEDYNAFIKQWVKGNNTKLECLIVHHYGTVMLPIMRQISMTEILKGIVSLPGCPKRYDPSNQYMDNDGNKYENGRDIIREDGKMSTLMIESGLPESLSLLFVVWHRKNPNVYNEFYNFHHLFC